MKIVVSTVISIAAIVVAGCSSSTSPELPECSNSDGCRKIFSDGGVMQVTRDNEVIYDAMTS